MHLLEVKRPSSVRYRLFHLAGIPPILQLERFFREETPVRRTPRLDHPYERFFTALYNFGNVCDVTKRVCYDDRLATVMLGTAHFSRSWPDGPDSMKSYISHAPIILRESLDGPPWSKMRSVFCARQVVRLDLTRTNSRSYARHCKIVKSISKHFPNVKELNLRWVGSGLSEDMPPLEWPKKLQSLNLELSVRVTDANPRPAYDRMLFKVVLAHLPLTMRRLVVNIHQSGYYYYYDSIHPVIERDFHTLSALEPVKHVLKGLVHMAFLFDGFRMGIPAYDIMVACPNLVRFPLLVNGEGVARVTKVHFESTWRKVKLPVLRHLQEFHDQWNPRTTHGGHNMFEILRILDRAPNLHILSFWCPLPLYRVDDDLARATSALSHGLKRFVKKARKTRGTHLNAYYVRFTDDKYSGLCGVTVYRRAIYFGSTAKIPCSGCVSRKRHVPCFRGLEGRMINFSEKHPGNFLVSI
jgi:hypothetical protein